MERILRGESFIQSIRSGDLTTLRKIVRNDQTIVNKMFERGTSLHYGADFGQLEVVNELLQFGAIQVSDSDGRTPLMDAAKKVTMNLCKL